MPLDLDQPQYRERPLFNAQRFRLVDFLAVAAGLAAIVFGLA